MRPKKIITVKTILLSIIVLLVTYTAHAQQTLWGRQQEEAGNYDVQDS